MRFALSVLFSLLSLPAFAGQDEFIYPSQFGGTHVRAKYDTSAYGYAKNNGYVSVFNVDRKAVESLLPPQFGLAKLDVKGSAYPLIVVWGEMSETGAVAAGIDWPYGLVYREMHFFIPGVYQKSKGPHELRTYTPRMFVDESEPEYLGRRFYYKKILLDKIKWDINSGMDTGDWASAKVLSSGKPTPVTGFDDKRWQAALAYLPQTDIMADNSKDPLPRCSGFEWLFDAGSKIAPAEVALTIHKKLVESMSDEIVGKELRSVVSYRVENWRFLVDYYYNNCGN
jgi:hypothetical protein